MGVTIFSCVVGMRLETRDEPTDGAGAIPVVPRSHDLSPGKSSGTKHAYMCGSVVGKQGESNKSSGWKDYEPNNAVVEHMKTANV